MDENIMYSALVVATVILIFVLSELIMAASRTWGENPTKRRKK